MSESYVTLSEMIDCGDVSLGRGEIISSDAIAATPGDYPVYSSSARGNGEFGRYGCYMFDEELITWSIDGGGRPFYRKKHRFSVTNVSGYLRIRNRNKWDYRYLQAAMELQHARISFDYQMKAHPSVIKNIYKFAPLPIMTQQRIAEILSTVDEAIEQTEALIAKTQAIKAGLMHDLFTRGVLPNGQLRPAREEAPQLYKQSPLGWIPREWESAILDELVSPNRPIMYGILMPGRGYPGGIPVIKVKDLVDGEIRSEDLLLTSPEIDAQYQRSKLKPGDILLSIRGTVGRLAQVPLHLDGANITQDTARIGIVVGSPEFYRYYLETDRPRRHFAVNTLGQAVQGINLRDVRTTPVPIVPDDEQIKITEMLLESARMARTEQENRAKLEQVKRGLMHDLLTGRVPVTALLDQRAAVTE